MTYEFANEWWRAGFIIALYVYYGIIPEGTSGCRLVEVAGDLEEVARLAELYGGKKVPALQAMEEKGGRKDGKPATKVEIFSNSCK